MRGINEDAILMLKEGALSPFLQFVKNKENHCFFGIRDNLVDIYCSGGKLIEIDFNSKKLTIKRSDYFRFNGKDKLINEVDLIGLNKEWNHVLLANPNRKIKKENGKDNMIIPFPKTTNEILDVITFLSLLQKVVTVYQRGSEKEVQYDLILKNNEENSYADYFISDSEYSIEGIKNTGRADLVAIKLLNENTVDVIFIEIKTKADAMKGIGKLDKWGSGVIGHFFNYVKMINNTVGDDFNFKEHIKVEINNQLRSYISLGLLPRWGNFFIFHSTNYNYNIEKMDFMVYIGSEEKNIDEAFMKQLGVANDEDNTVCSLLANPTKFSEKTYLTADEVRGKKYYYILSTLGKDGTGLQILKDIDRFEQSMDELIENKVTV